MQTRGMLAGLFAVAYLACPIQGMTGAQEIHGTPGTPNATTTIDGHVLPPPQKFSGTTELNAAQSKPHWAARVVPPKGAPNIL